MNRSEEHTAAVLLWGSGQTPTDLLTRSVRDFSGQPLANGEPQTVLDDALRPASDWVGAASFPTEDHARAWWQRFPDRASVDETALVTLDHTDRSTQLDQAGHAYVIIAVAVSDWDAFGAYGLALGHVVHRQGGSLLATGINAPALQDTSTQTVVAIMRWPSMQAATDFYESPAYRPHRDARRACSDASIVTIAADEPAWTGATPTASRA